MKTIIIDTNFLMIPAQFKVDIFSEIERVCRFPHELAVLDKSIAELERIAKVGKEKERGEAKLAMKLIDAYSLKRIVTDKEGDADAAIVALPKGGIIVATQDQRLKQFLKMKGIPLLILRQKKHLQLLGMA